MNDIKNRTDKIRNRLKDKKNIAHRSFEEIKPKNNKLRKNIILFSCALALNACSYITNPMPFGIYKGMQDGAPEGSPNFRAGWKDGCESGMAAYGSLHYKATHGYQYNQQSLSDDEYHAAWRVGFRHCRWYTAAWMR
ncbi:hypothetical protein N9W34_07085 [Rickettsiales bacterium]|nr:hypothetical protein [Rickettsiales bacterium]